MKSTIKLLLLIVIAASTIFADGDLGNGGYDDGDLGNGGKTCTVNCPAPTPSGQNSTGTTSQSTEETEEDDSILTTIEKYIGSLFG